MGDTVEVTFTLTNNGTRDGSEVAQLHVAFPEAAKSPPQQLKAFQRVHLRAGQGQCLTFELTTRDFSVWSVENHDWAGVSGAFGLRIGSSSRNIRLVGTMHCGSTIQESTEAKTNMAAAASSRSSA